MEDRGQIDAIAELGVYSYGHGTLHTPIPALMEGCFDKTGFQLFTAVLLTLFFSIGLLIDLTFIYSNIGTVLVLLFLVTIFKTATNTIILRFLGQSWPQAFMVSVVLSKIGEFSFLLSKTGLKRD